MTYKNNIKNKNKILLILNIPPPYGGGEIRAKILYDYFVNKTNYFLVTNSNQNDNKSTQGKFNFRNIFNNLVYQFQNSITILKVKPRVVYLSLPKKILPLLKIIPVLLSCKIVKAKIAGELAGSKFFFLEDSRIAQKLGILLLKQFFQIRLLGESVKQDLMKYGIDNTIVFDNGTEVKNYHLNQAKNLNKDLISISFIGALHKNKGIYILSEVANILSKKNIPFIMNIVGEWENLYDQQVILQYIKEYNLDSKVIFHGFKKDDEKWNILKQTDIYLFPSYNEGQPISIIEAMAFGIPVITSNVGAIPETIKNDENGFILEKQNPEQYVEKIIYLKNNSKLYNKISINNLETYKERFTVDKYCKSAENWLNKI